MNPVVAAGLLIGVLCVVWTFVMGLTGWYKDPVMLNAFFVVILIEIGGLIWGLRKTAAEGRTYGRQVLAGTLMATIAGVVIIVGSMIFTTMAYPDYFEELAAMQREMLQAAGTSEAEIAQAMEAQRWMQTPLVNALMGFVGTVVTGIVASAIVAVWVRARAARPASPRV